MIFVVVAVGLYHGLFGGLALDETGAVKTWKTDRLIPYTLLQVVRSFDCAIAGFVTSNALLRGS